MELNYKFSSAFRSLYKHNEPGGICNSALKPDFLDNLSIDNLLLTNIILMAMLSADLARSLYGLELSLTGLAKRLSSLEKLLRGIEMLLPGLAKLLRGTE